MRNRTRDKKEDKFPFHTSNKNHASFDKEKFEKCRQSKKSESPQNLHRII